MDVESRGRSDGSISKHGGNPRTTYLLYFLGLVSLAVLILVAILVGNMSSNDSSTVSSAPNGNAPLVITPDEQPLGLPGMEQATWESITLKAKSQVVNFYLYSPLNSSSQTWVDDILADHMKTTYGVQVNRIDAVYSGCKLSPMAVACDVTQEIQAGKKTSGGGVDLIWINGVNFENMKKLNLLYGPWATLIPNAANFDFTNPRISFDKGVPISGMEFPFNGAQSVFLYDKAAVTLPPRTVPDLITWIKANNKKFTYADPSLDFTGACFMRILFYYYCADSVGVKRSDWLGALDLTKYNTYVQKLWDVLNEIEPFLTMNSVTGTYYNATDDVLDLINNGQNSLAFSFNAAEAAQRIAAKTWPSTMQAYVFTSGTISDTNYIAIPINSQNKEAALLTVNHIASPHSLFQRSLPQVWGALQVYDVTSPAIMEWNVAFDHVATDSSIPSVEELAAAQTADLPADLVNQLNEDWVKKVKNV